MHGLPTSIPLHTFSFTRNIWGIDKLLQNVFFSLYYKALYVSKKYSELLVCGVEAIDRFIWIVYAVGIIITGMTSSFFYYYF